MKNESFDTLCHLSKNLYNRANYLIRQHYFEMKEYLNYLKLDKIMQKEKCYKVLPAATSQQTLRIFDKNWKSFFANLKSYQKNPEKFKHCPHIPHYKEKEGKNIVAFTNIQVKLRNGYIVFPNRSLKKCGIFLNPLRTKITSNLQQVRIIPQATCYVVEVVYRKECEIDKDLNKCLFLGIDLGVNNLATCVSSELGTSLKPILIKGGIIKSINQYYNKMKAVYMSYVGNRGISKRILRLTNKRNCCVRNYLHHTSRFIINYCLENHIGNIVIGKNDNWKQEVNLGKKTNQNFVNIPFNTLIQQITYKAEEVGIRVVLTEESYTSKVDHLVNETMEHHETYLGKRVKRGLFRSSVGMMVNADVNGALGILRKVIGNDFLQSVFFEEEGLNRGLVVNPLKAFKFS